MLSSVSFTSTYKVTNQNPNTNVRFNIFKNYADKIAKTASYAGAVFKKETIEKSFYEKPEPKTEETLIVRDNLDRSVEEFCARNGIKFEKLYAHDLLDPSKIKSRIQDAPKGYKKVEVDVGKLEELIQGQQSNIPILKRDYKNGLFYPSYTTLLEGSDFPATILRINPIEDFNQEQMVIDFVKSENSLDCYTYFILKQIGIENIPVYVDDLTYKAGRAMGLFKSNAS